MPPPGPRLGSPEIFGYLPNWSLDATIDYGAITTIAYFGLSAGSDGHLVRTNANGSPTMEYSRWKGTAVTNAIAAAHAAGDRFVLTVERMAWDSGGQAATTTLLSNPDARSALASDIASEITTRGVDGVSLDFEPIMTSQRDNFADFVRALRAALDAVNPAYQLTFAATGSQVGKTYQMIGDLTASGFADAVIIMGYPLRAIDAKYAGGLSPMYSATSYDLKEIVRAYLGTPISGTKIVLALPWYGRQWPTQSSDLNALVQTDRTLYDRPYNIGYTDALEVAGAYGRQLDPVEESAWTEFRWRYCDSAPETWKEVYYEDVDTLGYKYDWAKSQGLAGIGIFALGYDGAQPEFWKLLRLKYRGLVDTTPPTGSFALDPGDHLCAAPRVKLDFQVGDESGGSGAVFVRVSNASGQSGGVLTAARTYPVTSQVDWPMDDATTGGSTDTGSRTVYAQWRDVAGNWSPVSSTTINLSLPGTGNLTVAGGATNVSTSTIKVQFDQVGGRAITAVRLSNSAAITNGVLANTVAVPLGQPVDFSLIDASTGGADVDGAHTVYAQSQDSNGCWSPIMSSAVTLDRAAPSGTVAIVGAPVYALTRDVQVQASASDSGSGVSQVELSNDGTNWTTFPYSDSAISWSAGSSQSDGPWTIYARWQDVVGNWSSTATTSTILDTHGPTGSITLNAGATATRDSTVTVAAPASDAASGVANTALSNDGTNWTSSAYSSAGITWSAGASQADGTWTVYAKWQDGAGLWSDVKSASILLDRTPPTVTAPQVGLPQGAQLNTAAVPVSVAWQSTDAVSGVASELLEKSSDGTTWYTAIPIGSQSGSPAVVTVDPASAWQMRVSATDVAGNAAAPVVGQLFGAKVSQESATSIVYSGTWYKAKMSSASGGATRYATTRGATASLSFTGRAVSWVAPRGTKVGKAKVFIDGVLMATIDLKAASAQPRMLVFAKTWTASGQHTIKIKVLGTSGRPRVDLDAFVVLS